MAKVVAGVILSCVMFTYSVTPYLVANLISASGAQAFERQELTTLARINSIGKTIEQGLNRFSPYTSALDHSLAQIALDLGLIHFQQGQADLAQIYFDQAMVQAPTYAYLYIRLADTLSRSKAYSYLATYFVDIPSAVHDSELFLLELGQAYWYNQQPGQAEQVFGLLLEQYPSVQSYLQISDLYFAAGLPNTALTFCKRGLDQLEENNPALLFCNGQAEFLLNNYQEAVRVFENLIIVSPQNAKFNHWLARTYARINRYDESITYGQRAIENDPRNVWYIAQVGNVYQLEGEYSKANEYYQQALALDPTNEVIQEYLIKNLSKNSTIAPKNREFSDSE